MSELNLDAMQREELETTANELGVKFAANAGDDTLRKKIRVHLGEETDTPSVPADTSEGGKEKRYEIVIQTDGNDKQPVPVGVNGKMWVIQRGKNVIVPASVIGVLKNAVRYEYDPKDMKRTEVLAYPFQVVREIEA